SRPPQITNTLGFLEPDGREIVLELRGVNFSKFADVRTEPACPNCRATVISTEKINLFLTLPVLQENKNYQILINNPDGQQAVKGFTALAKRLDSAHAVSATKRALFSGQEALIAVALTLKRYERLNPNAGYELIMGGGAFRASQTRNDSTLIFQVRIPQAPLDTENTMHPFSVRVAGKAARWGGMLAAVTAPKVTGISENMIIHPTDTLQVILKGAYLENVVASFEDPELSIQVLESAGDRLRFNVIAGPDVALGTFPLVLNKDKVKFRLDEMPIHVRAWEQFDKFIGIETSAIGRIGGERLWTGHSTTIKIKSDDSILIRFYGPQINPELGIQKVRVRAVLLDSSNAMQPQVLTDQLIRVNPGKNTPGYSLPLRGRLSSGDWIELQVMNPGNMNRTMQLFFVERQWHEAFRGAISYSLIQVPFDSDKESRFLGSLGFGINYIPWVNRPFISFDWDFMIGNPVSTAESVNVDVGMGVSVILWNYLQLGIGTNFSGSPFSEPFIYLGSRLALPFSKPNS
ncbi:hypothetical protein KAH55_01475, partial [bacterium]|nr:hypothetical protein [bacterium]